MLAQGGPSGKRRWMEIVSVQSRKARKSFVDLPRRLMGEMPAFVPPLTFSEVKRIDPRRNPFFAHAQAGFWLAMEGGVPIGRISATRDELSLEYQQDGTGFFGHPLARDEATLHALLGVAEDFLRAKGLHQMRGPIELSTNYTCGLQVTTFDLPPMLEMNQHPPGMDAWHKSYGLEGVKDLLAFRIREEELDLQRLQRVRAISQKRSKARIRTLDLKRFPQEVQVLHKVYVQAWEKNFGFAPMSKEEFEAAAKDFKTILDPRLCLVAEQEGEAVGFLLALPDAHQGFRACNGRLFPFGIFQFLSAMRKVHSLRVLTLGVIPKLRGKGLDARLILELIERGLQAGYNEAELSWVLEDNLPMVKPILDLGGHEAQRYRLYEKPLSQ
ncbi:MAG TPA: GNAT family N-acetyltransferase [Planctomycetes bacterium]|nr:GNAT family N-acetyltransferase [Planctomycetota bacterium]